MSRLDELIQQYCPDGVEYVRFVDYANVLYGCPFDAAQFTNDSSYIPLIRIRDVLSGKAGTYYKGEYSHDYIIKKGDILVGMDGNFNLGIWDDIDGLLCQRVCKLYTKDETRLLNGFIRHYMKPVFRQIEESTPGGSVKHLSAKAINSIHIPLPPLPVQEEIVRVLDAFTELQAELQAELQKRKQQYNYYLDNLLNFKNINRGGYQAEVRWMKLKDVCMKTSNIKWKSTTGQYRYIDLSSVDIQTHSIISTIEIDKMSAPSRAQQIVQEDDVIFATTRPTQMRACIIPTQYNGDICSTGYCVLRVDTKILLPRFLFFSLTVSGFKTYLSNNLTLGNYPSISNNTLLEYEVPVPSLANQQRIVAILDRFDTLTTDLTQGLPAEIEKRRQQYEYYRDKLLTFKRKGA